MADRAMLCVVVAFGLAVAACSHGTSSPQAASGTLRGTLETVGGAAPGTPHPVDGTVYLLPMHGKTVIVTVGSDGAFEARVAVGSYTVTGTSPQYEINGVDAPCGPSPSGTFFVGANKTVVITLACAEK